MPIDLNADLGEGAPFDAELMPLITSANVCCGAHASDPATIAATLRLAKTHGVVVGAHPGYPERTHFGRRELHYAKHELIDVVTQQIESLSAMAREVGVAIDYVKPHGALYNQGCRDRTVADAIVDAVAPFRVPLVGLPGSQLEAACGGRIPFVPEGFADRRYRPDGSLVPRREPDAFIHDPEAAVAQVEWLVRDRGVRTVCIHGDNPAAVAFARAVREALLARGVTLHAFTTR